MLTTFGSTSTCLGPLATYVERAGLLGDVDADLGPDLGRLLDGADTASSPVFTRLGPAIRSSLESLDAAKRTEGIRRLQLALQFAGPDSKVAAEIVRKIGEPERVVLRKRLESEAERLRVNLGRYDKGFLGRIAVRLPHLVYSSHDFPYVGFLNLEDLCRVGNLQAARRLSQLGRLKEILNPGYIFSKPHSEMISWLALSEYFARPGSTSSPRHQWIPRGEPFQDFKPLVVDGFLMSALQCHRGDRLLDLDTPYLTVHHVQTWIGHWVDALKDLNRRIDLHEGRNLAKRRPHGFTKAMIATLLEIAGGNVSERAMAKSNPTERAEAAEEARVILQILQGR